MITKSYINSYHNFEEYEYDELLRCHDIHLPEKLIISKSLELDLSKANNKFALSPSLT